MQNNSSYLNDEIKGIVHQFWINGLFFHASRKKQKKQSGVVCKKTQNLTSILRLSTILTQWAYGFIGKKTAEHICVLVCPWKKLKSTITQLTKHNSFVRKGRKI